LMKWLHSPRWQQAFHAAKLSIDQTVCPRGTVDGLQTNVSNDTAGSFLERRDVAE
jgi:hypothetical protein